MLSIGSIVGFRFPYLLIRLVIVW